ncbi:MAG: ATP-binding protein [Dorea sp.]|nr:ATP-binding protein [Dorea sp.]
MKSFNTAGVCIPEAHYMADTSATITQIISQYVSPGKYFTIDRPRQCGKTTTLYLLEERLKSRNIVLSISFESADELFASLYHLATGFIRKTARALRLQGLSKQICTNWQRPVSKDFPLDDLGQRITELCTDCRQNIILMIDEADKSSDNQIFLSFLGLLREKYLDQMKGRDKTFHSVILAGVYDVKNLKLKLHPDIEPKYYSYESENHRIHIGKIFGFLKDEQGIVSISNRIFEMKLYNLLISENETDSRIFTAADMEKNQFIKDGTLHMELVIQKFCEYFEEIYADADDRSIEDNGRRIFLIFLKPIINGSGNYYIESRTRNLKRTDIIIDYKGTQNIIELKIWHGEEYNRRGEEQLLEYMDYYHLKKGYMLSFNFNKNKQTGIRRMMFQDRLLIEAVV